MTSGGIGAQTKEQQEKNRPKDIRNALKNSTQAPYEGQAVKDFGLAAKLPGKISGIGAYSERQEKTGKTDPGIEAAIKHFGTTNTKIQVQTKQGVRVVTMDEAVRDYADQISSGSAIVADGENKGKKVSEVTGVTTTGVVPGKDGVPNTATEDAKSGMTTEAVEIRDKLVGVFGGDEGKKGKNSGVLRIEPSPELAKLLNFKATGNVDVDTSAAQGVPPAVNGPVK
jgi:hypothetical protein